MKLIHDIPTLIWLIIAIGGLLALLLPMLRLPRARDACYRRKPLLTPWERAALQMFADQIPPGHYICPQVRLADMLSIHARNRAGYLRARNRVVAKSVDFVIVELASGNPVLVVELDDKSHAREDRQNRDALVNAVLREAEIAVVRFRPKQRIDIRPFLAIAASRGIAAA
jgi:hypothetical protein